MNKQIAKYFFGVLLIVLTIGTIKANAWSPLPVWSGWDGSTYWKSDMPIDSPGIPTNDQIISSWDNDVRLSDELRILFMKKKIIQAGALYKKGVRERSWGFYGEESKSFKIINDIAKAVWDKFQENFFCVSYFPQFKAFNIILHPDKSKDVKLHADIAKHLESMRIEKCKEFFGGA